MPHVSALTALATVAASDASSSGCGSRGCFTLCDAATPLLIGPKACVAWPRLSLISRYPHMQKLIHSSHESVTVQRFLRGPPFLLYRQIPYISMTATHSTRSSATRNYPGFSGGPGPNSNIPRQNNLAGPYQPQLLLTGSSYRFQLFMYPWVAVAEVSEQRDKGTAKRLHEPLSQNVQPLKLRYSTHRVFFSLRVTLAH